MKKTNVSKFNIDKVLSYQRISKSKWELDTIVWPDRHSDPVVLQNFLNRIKELQSDNNKGSGFDQELDIMLELLSEMNEQDCIELLTNYETVSQEIFIEKMARRSSIEVLTNGKVSYSTMETMCKLSPNDFIMVSKRTQDLLDSIMELVVQGETLSKESAGYE